MSLYDEYMDGLADLEQAHRIAGYEAGYYAGYGRSAGVRRGARASWWLILLAVAVIAVVILTQQAPEIANVTQANPFKPNVGAFRPIDDRDLWCADLLAALGNNAPSAETGAYCSAWTLAEDSLAGGALAGNNPLNTSQDMPGATVFNEHGVKRYQSRADGIAATVMTLGYNYDGYSDIREGLKTNDPERALKGLASSPWGTNASNVRQLYREILPRYLSQ